jgi:glutathione S-transferase
MVMSHIRLLGRTGSINVRKVLWVLREIGAPFTHEADWATPQRPTSLPKFRTLNPNGLVPVLIDENGTFIESNTICRYLADKFDRQDLLPKSPTGRALIERWMDWQATDLNTAWRYAFMALVRQDPAYKDQNMIAASTKAWNDKMTLLDSHLGSTTGYVAGGHLTLADIVLAVSAHRWEMTLIERPTLPHVTAWLQHLRLGSAAAECLTPENP